MQVKQEIINQAIAQGQIKLMPSKDPKVRWIEDRTEFYKILQTKKSDLE